MRCGWFGVVAVATVLGGPASAQQTDYGGCLAGLADAYRLRVEFNERVMALPESVRSFDQSPESNQVALSASALGKAMRDFSDALEAMCDSFEPAEDEAP